VSCDVACGSKSSSSSELKFAMLVPVTFRTDLYRHTHSLNSILYNTERGAPSWPSYES
jgi:hypothetical protein